MLIKVKFCLKFAFSLFNLKPTACVRVIGM